MYMSEDKLLYSCMLYTLLHCKHLFSNILVCDNYISPYFFATCIQYNSAVLLISLLLACTYIFSSFANGLLFMYIKED